MSNLSERFSLTQSVAKYFSSARAKKAAYILAVLAFIIVTCAGAVDLYYYVKYHKEFNASWSAMSKSITDAEFDDSEDSTDCNVLGIELRGGLHTYVDEPSNADAAEDSNVEETASEDIYFAIDGANKNETVKAILIEVDSSGGSPVAAEEVNEAVKQSDKPVIAYIREIGTSAAYYAVSGVDRLFAARLADVGGIGVTASFFDNTKKNEKDGLTYHVFSTGKFKNMFDSDKELTKEEERLIMDDINFIHDRFVTVVSENRNIDLAKVKELADGRTFIGEKALGLGLVDELGDYFTVKNYLQEKVLDGDDVKICW